MKRLTCEMCGSTDLMKNEGVFICQSCGCKYSVEEAKKMMLEGAVEVSGNVSIQGKVDFVDHKVESDLALAENTAKMYFELGKDAVKVGALKGYDAVISQYSRLEVNGGSSYASFWLSLARFYVKGNIKSLQTGERILFDREKMIYFYKLYMDNAIRYACSQEEREKYEKEKNETEEYFGKELLNFKENKQAQKWANVWSKLKGM